jgi:quercetin dioxygenase-like cupin family protein
MNFPFEERQEGDTVIRTFEPEVETFELIWHFDLEDRDITVIQGGGWSFQEDGKLPVKLENGDNFLVKKGLWHRVHKGDEPLVVQIKMLTSQDQEE